MKAILSMLTVVVFLGLPMSGWAQTKSGNLDKIKDSIKSSDNGDVVIEAAAGMEVNNHFKMLCELFFYKDTWNKYVATFLEKGDAHPEEFAFRRFLEAKRCGAVEGGMFSEKDAYKSIGNGIPVGVVLTATEETLKKIQARSQSRPKDGSKDGLTKYVKDGIITVKSVEQADSMHRWGLLVGFNKTTKEFLFNGAYTGLVWLSEKELEDNRILKVDSFFILKLSSKYEDVYKELASL